MSDEREKSAIDAIYELLAEVKEIRKELKIMDSNIKLLNNKVAKLSLAATPAIMADNTSATSTNSRPSATAPIGVSVKPTAIDSQPLSKEPETTVKVFGRIKNQRQKPITGVYIKIYDPKGEVIKTRETDAKGYWEARVSPGQYVIELNAQHINKKFIPKNFNIEVTDKMNEYEVK